MTRCHYTAAVLLALVLASCAPCSDTRDAGAGDASSSEDASSSDAGDAARLDCNPCPLTCPLCVVDTHDCSISGCL